MHAGVPYFLRGMTSGSNIRLRIRYSDSSVGRTLQVTVTDWVESLVTKKIPSWVRFVEARADFFTAYTPYFSAAAFLFAASKADFTFNPFNKIMVSFAVAMMFWVVGRSLTMIFFRQIEIIKPLTFIDFTVGDTARREKVCKMVDRRKLLAFFIFVTLVTGVAINLFSTMIANRIGL